MNPALWIATLVGVLATVEDLTRRQVSNWISGGALAAGLAYQAYASGWSGAGTGLAGAVCGFGVFLVFYLLGGMGGGDIKLMAGFGALLGPGRLLEATLCTAMVGGLMAAAALAISRFRGRAADGCKGRLSIPYAPAISIGAFIALMPAPKG